MGPGDRPSTQASPSQRQPQPPPASPSPALLALRGKHRPRHPVRPASCSGQSKPRLKPGLKRAAKALLPIQGVSGGSELSTHGRAKARARHGDAGRTDPAAAAEASPERGRGPHRGPADRTVTSRAANAGAQRVKTGGRQGKEGGRVPRHWQGEGRPLTRPLTRLSRTNTGPQRGSEPGVPVLLAGAVPHRAPSSRATDSPEQSRTPTRPLHQGTPRPPPAPPAPQKEGARCRPIPPRGAEPQPGSGCLSQAGGTQRLPGPDPHHLPAPPHQDEPPPRSQTLQPC